MRSERQKQRKETHKTNKKQTNEQTHTQKKKKKNLKSQGHYAEAGMHTRAQTRGRGGAPLATAAFGRRCLFAARLMQIREEMAAASGERIHREKDTALALSITTTLAPSGGGGGATGNATGNRIAPPLPHPTTTNHQPPPHPRHSKLR